MNDEDLGPKPEAASRQPERFPGGADSVADKEKYGDLPDDPTVPDLDPDANPAVDADAPEEVKEPDDKQQEPDDAEAMDEEAGTPRGEGTDEEPEPPA